MIRGVIAGGVPGRRAALVAAAATGLLALPAAAHAGNAARSDPVGDSAPGSNGPGPAFTDIREVKHGHTKGERLRHVVFVRDANRATKGLTQLQVTAGGKLYLIDAAGVNRFRAQGPAERSERAGKRKAKVKRRGNKIVFKFSPRAIGDPRKYRWAATIGSNDTSPLDFDRAPDGAALIKHRLRSGSGGGNRGGAKRARFRGYRAGADGKPGRVATQGALHEFVFVDRKRKRTRYTLVLNGPGHALLRTEARTGRRGRDRVNESLFVNDVGGPGKWKVGGERVARYRFRLEPEFEG